jgi:hypothetical protein
MPNDKANMAQRSSRSYLLSAEDTEFLLRDEMRAIRFAREYGKAELLLRDWGVRSTVVVFGGARIPSPEHARHRPINAATTIVVYWMARNDGHGPRDDRVFLSVAGTRLL